MVVNEENTYGEKLVPSSRTKTFRQFYFATITVVAIKNTAYIICLLGIAGKKLGQRKLSPRGN